MFLCSTANKEADLGCKEVLEMLCDISYYPMIITCKSSSSVLTEELNRIISEGSKPVLLRMISDSRLEVCSKWEHEKHGLIFPHELLPTITDQVALAQELLDFEAARTCECECSISGLIPDLSEWKTTSSGSIVVSLSSKVQWTVIGGWSLLEGFDRCPTKPSEICQNPVGFIDSLQPGLPAPMSTVEHDNISDTPMTQEAEYQETATNASERSEQYVDIQVATSAEATFQGEENLDLVQGTGSVGNTENYAGHGALGDPLKESSVQRVFKGVMSLMQRFWSAHSLLFLWLGEILYFLGQKIGFRHGLLMLTIMGFGFPGIYQTSKSGPIASLEHKSSNTQHFNLEILSMPNGPKVIICSILELEKDSIVLTKNLSSSITQQVAPVDHFSWQPRMHDTNEPGTCPRSISGNQWNVMEGQDLLRTLIANFEGSNISLPKPSETCQELHCVVGALLSVIPTCEPNNTYRICHGDYQSIAKVASSHQITEKDESERFIDKQAVNSSVSMFEGEANGGLQGFMHHVYLLKYDFATLMYVIAHSLMLMSLVLQQTEREWMSHVMAGAAYSCVILGILGYSFSRIPFDYACYGFIVLFAFALFSLFYSNNTDETDEV